METFGIILVSTFFLAAAVLIALKPKTNDGVVKLCALVCAGGLAIAILWELIILQGRPDIVGWLASFMGVTLMTSVICLGIRSLVHALRRD